MTNVPVQPVNTDCLEVCAGAGGQALGLEQAGFRHVTLVDNDPDACATLRANRPGWNVLTADIREFSETGLPPLALLAGGPPCQPFSIGGARHGATDERDLFPQALRLIGETLPQAVMLENVTNILSPRFASYRDSVISALHEYGYTVHWQVLSAADYGVPQTRLRAVLVALRPGAAACYQSPVPVTAGSAPTVGDALGVMMAAGGWPGAQEWSLGAGAPAPTIVGGSRKHGGPDLGPQRTRQAWRKLGVDGTAIANEPPGPGGPPGGMPRLTLEMVAALQGFPLDWEFCGGKTSVYRQVGNAFPAPVAQVIGTAILAAIRDCGSS